MSALLRRWRMEQPFAAPRAWHPPPSRYNADVKFVLTGPRVLHPPVETKSTDGHQTLKEGLQRRGIP
ncbi:MAG: hypothetical protein ABIG70_04385, partial [Pseudomonadota bacterium]